MNTLFERTHTMMWGDGATGWAKRSFRSRVKMILRVQQPGVPAGGGLRGASPLAADDIPRTCVCWRGGGGSGPQGSHALLHLLPSRSHARTHARGDGSGHLIRASPGLIRLPPPPLESCAALWGTFSKYRQFVAQGGDQRGWRRGAAIGAQDFHEWLMPHKEACTFGGEDAGLFFARVFFFFRFFSLWIRFSHQTRPENTRTHKIQMPSCL